MSNILQSLEKLTYTSAKKDIDPDTSFSKKDRKLWMTFIELIPPLYTSHDAHNIIVILLILIKISTFVVTKY